MHQEATERKYLFAWSTKNVTQAKRKTTNMANDGHYKCWVGQAAYCRSHDSKKWQKSNYNMHLTSASVSWTSTVRGLQLCIASWNMTFHLREVKFVANINKLLKYNHSKAMNMHICAIYFTEILFVRPLIATGTNCKLVSIKQHYFLMKKTILTITYSHWRTEISIIKY